MPYGADPSLSTVDMHTIGYPVAGSDGTYIRTLLTDNTGRLLVTAASAASTGAFTDRSGIIAAGGTAQQAAAANASRKKFIIQNTSVTAYIAFSFTGTAGAQGTAGSYILQPGQFFTTDPDGCPTGSWSVYSPTTGATWAASEL